MPEIGADLENVAAAPAEAQRSEKGEISTLEGALQDLDDEIGEAIELENNSRPRASERQLLEHFVAHAIGPI